MDRLFLDANVLFSTAYREDSGLVELWKLDTVELVTSAYALEEARRNLNDDAQRQRLHRLVQQVTIVPESDIALPEDVGIREKDVPILKAAVASESTHLVTGDHRDFGPHFGKKLAGVNITLPRRYLESKKTSG